MENKKINELIIVPGDDEDDSIVFSPKLDYVMAIIDSIKMVFYPIYFFTIFYLLS